MSLQSTIRHQVYRFRDLAEVFAKANEPKSGDQLAAVAAETELERCAAKAVLADLPLSYIWDHPLIDPSQDDVTRLIQSDIDQNAFAKWRALTVGELRDAILSGSVPQKENHRAFTPEIIAAVTKLMSNKDLILAARPIRTITKCRNTMGEVGVLGIRLQPNHSTDSIPGILASTIDGLLYGCGDAVIGVNPATESVDTVSAILRALNTLCDRLKVPTQVCCLAHISTQLASLRTGAPVDLLFQSIAGTEAANASFGITLAQLQEGQEAILEHHRTRTGEFIGTDVMYFETGQGSALSSGSHHGIDQLTLEARAYGVARHYKCFLINSVVGFIGPEYLFDERQIIRAGLEDHFMGKMLGLPMGCDVCYTNHAAADQNSADNLLTLLSAAGCNYFMGVPCSDDIMLSYQSTSFHDAVSMRNLFDYRPTPEFAQWLATIGLNPLDLAATPAARMLLNNAVQETLQIGEGDGH